MEYGKVFSSRNRGLLVVGILLSAVALFGVFHAFSQTANDSVAGNRPSEFSAVSEEIPFGVNSHSPDSVGMFAAQAAFNVNLEVDGTSNDALLRNARSVLSSSLNGDLESYSQAGSFVEGSRFDSFRDQGMTGFAPSAITKIGSDQEESGDEDSDSSTERSYEITVTPTFDDSTPGSPITVTVELSLSQHGNDWRVTSFRQSQ